MARRQRGGRGRRSPQGGGSAPPGGGTGGSSFGNLEPYFSERSIGRAVDHSMEAVGGYLQAQAAGQTFNPMSNLGPIGGAVGAVLGAPWGAPGMMLGSMLLSGAGNMISGIFNAKNQFMSTGYLAASQTGYNTFGMGDSSGLNLMGGVLAAADQTISGNPYLAVMGSRLASMPDMFNPSPLNARGRALFGVPQYGDIGMAAAYMGLGEVGQIDTGAGGSAMRNAQGVLGITHNLISQFGSPMINGKPNAGFSNAMQELNPVLQDPLLEPFYNAAMNANLYRGRPVGAETIQASILEVGPSATCTALNTQTPEDRNAFGPISSRMANRAIESQISSVGAGGAGTILQEALMEGNRPLAETDFGNYFTAQQSNIDALQRQKSPIRSELFK